MSRLLISGAAILLTTMGTAAVAQSLPSSSSTTTTTTSADAYGETTKTQKVMEHTVDADGTEITKSKTYQSGDGSLSGTTKLQVRSPDGLTKTVEHQETTVATPAPVPLTSRETTTTTTTER